MTKEQFWQKFNELKVGASEGINKRAAHILNSGAIDLESGDDNYLLPRIVLFSCLEHEAGNLVPVRITRRIYRL